MKWSRRIERVILSICLCFMHSCLGDYRVKLDAAKLFVPAGGQICLQQRARQQDYDKVCGKVGSSEAERSIEFDLKKDLVQQDDRFFVQGFHTDGRSVVSTMEFVVQVAENGELAVEQVHFEAKDPVATRECTLKLVEPSQGAILLDPKFVHIKGILVGCKVPQDGFIKVIQARVSTVESVLDRMEECSVTADGVPYCWFLLTASQLSYGTHSVNYTMVEKETGAQIPWSEDSETFSVVNILPKEIVRSDPAGRISYRAWSPIELGPAAQRRCRVAMVGNYNLDGQKTIWTYLLKELIRRKDVFEIEYFFFLERQTNAPFADVLDSIGVPYLFSPLLILPGPHSTQSPETMVGNVVASLDLLLSLPPFRNSRTCSAQVKPRKSLLLCDRLLYEFALLFVPYYGTGMILTLLGSLAGFDTLLYGNARVDSDLLLQKSAELLGIPLTMMDLPNLSPVKGLFPTVVVAPSWYSHDHPSIRSLHSHNVVVYPGIDFSHFRPNLEPSSKTDFRDRPIRIGYLARVSPEKSPGMFVHLAKALLERNPSLTFDFVMGGSGPVEHAVRFLASLHKVPIRFVGHVPYEKVPSFLSELDLTVHLALEETFCFSNIESMAMGVPVITFAATAVSEYAIHGVNSWIANEPTLDSLVQVAEEAIRTFSPDLPAKCAASVQRFTSRAMVDGYMHLILDLSGQLR